jgi:hypothetical protein
VVRRDGLRHRMDIYLFTTGRPRLNPLTFDEAREAIKSDTAQLVSSTLKVEDGRVYWLHTERAKDSGISAWKVTDGSWVTDLRRVPEEKARHRVSCYDTAFTANTRSGSKYCIKLYSFNRLEAFMIMAVTSICAYTYSPGLPSGSRNAPPIFSRPWSCPYEIGPFSSPLCF